MHPSLISKVSWVSLLSKRNRERARKTSEQRAHLWLGQSTDAPASPVSRPREQRTGFAGQSVAPKVWYRVELLHPLSALVYSPLAAFFVLQEEKNPNENKRKEEKSQCLADEKCRKEVIIEKFVQWNWPTNQPAVLYNNNENNNCNNGTEGAKTVIN